MKIIVRYNSVDRYSERRTFKTLKFARRYAHKWIGEHPEIGCGYAVSGDGIGKITVDGATLDDLFGPEKSAPLESGEMSQEEWEYRCEGEAAAIEAEKANERHFEGNGYDADYDRRMEDSRGVIQFDDAFRAACPEKYNHEKEEDNHGSK